MNHCQNNSFSIDRLTQVLWWNAQNKTKIDVNQMTVRVQQNISIVSEILNECQQIFLKSAKYHCVTGLSLAANMRWVNTQHTTA